jgi:cytosine/adenosine deaminase-related metal-dependent hydrolase
METAGVSGASLYELMGRDEAVAEARLEAALKHGKADRRKPHLLTGVTPHAPYSLHPNLLEETAKEAPPLLSIHYAESPHEGEDWYKNTGAVLSFLERLGVPTGPKRAWQEGPITKLQKHFSGPLLRVHDIYPEQYNEEIGGFTVICPRSSLYIDGACRDPEVLAVYGIGTDSLASAPDLNVQGELRALKEQFPDTSARDLWQAVTEWPADALGWQAQAGSFTEGATPGMVLLPMDVATEEEVWEAALHTTSRTLVQGRLTFAGGTP